MFVQGPMSFYTLRFLLGITEAGFFPGVMLYLTYWYPAARRSWATGLFYMGLPIANMFSNPLSGGLLELDGLLGMDGIHWMFLVEGLLAVVAGFICPFVLVDRPANARWLTQDEKEHLSEQIAHEEAAKHEAKPISWKQAMLDPRILYFCLIYLCIQASVYGLTFFLPKQVVNMTNGEAGLKAPPHHGHSVGRGPDRRHHPAQGRGPPSEPRWSGCAHAGLLQHRHWGLRLLPAQPGAGSHPAVHRRQPHLHGLPGRGPRERQGLPARVPGRPVRPQRPLRPQG